MMILAGILLCCSQNRQKPVQQTAPPETSTMKATILRKVNFPNIPSASGMEVIGDKVYIIGDDSPYLYVLDLVSLQLSEKIQLFETTSVSGTRIPKATKPDLECLTILDINNKPHLAAFGSGSASTRNLSYLISLPTSDSQPPIVTEKSLDALYKVLQENEDLLKGDLLNIEAAATTPDQQLFLFQRSTQAGPNVVFVFNAPEFIRHLTHQTKVPAYQTIFFNLPRLQGLDARFSGASTHQNLLFFSASVENTTNAILDGEVLGSYIGWLDIIDIKAKKTSKALPTALVLDEQGQPYKGKIESLAIIGNPQAAIYRCLAITDNDNGESELLELEITL